MSHLGCTRNSLEHGTPQKIYKALLPTLVRRKHTIVKNKLQKNPNLANELGVHVLNSQKMREHSKSQPKSSTALLQPKYNNFSTNNPNQYPNQFMLSELNADTVQF